MRAKVFSTSSLVWILATFGFCALTAPSAYCQSLKLEAQLLWGTNDKTSPNPKHKPVAPEIEKKLKDLPLKWTHYFVVTQTNFTVPHLKSAKVSLSEHCTVEIKDLGNSTIEISHFGRGERVWTGKQSLPKGDVLLLGGNAPSSTSWLVSLKRIE
jgi:hypothetical protein